jgi:beta-lactamase superfamily II metal-dependent hydrolase
MNTPSNSNGAAYADLDNDGDLDLVVNNINTPAFVFENRTEESNFLAVKLAGEAANTIGVGARVTILVDGQKQLLEQMPARGYLSAVSHVLHFGLGELKHVDSLHVRWNGGKEQWLTNVPANKVLVLRESDGAQPERRLLRRKETVFTISETSIDHRHHTPPVNDFKRQPQLLAQLSHGGPVIAKADVNNDGLEDLYVGGGAGQPGELHLANGDGFMKKNVSGFAMDKAFADAAAVFADIDNDGDLDLYVASGGYHQLEPEDRLLQDRIYLNEGSGDFVPAAAHALPDMRTSKGCVAVDDVNGDGYVDFFVGGRVIPGKYPETPSSYLLINQKNGTFKDEIGSRAPDLKNSYRITDALWVNLDSNEEKELVVVGEWMPVTIFKKQKDGFVNTTNHFIAMNGSGWWNKIITGDFNSDGKPDLLIGNWGLNSQYTVSSTEPAELFYDDFDHNGSIDPILCTYVQGKRYPYLTRDEMLEQLGHLRSRFRDYKSYAPAALEDVLSAQQIERAKKLQVDHLETTYLQSTPSGKLERVALPTEVQYAPVHSMLTGDFNSDGHEDIILSGNDSNAKLKIGKINANNGIFLKGDGNGKFDYVPQAVSGLNLTGDVRNAFIIKNRIYFPVLGGSILEYRFSPPRLPLISSRTDP